jgi:hypothetical protein
MIQEVYEVILRGRDSSMPTKPRAIYVRGLIAALFVISLMAPMTMAQQSRPSTQPGQGQRRGDGPGALGRRAAGAAGAAGTRRVPISRQELDDATEWTRQYMPNLHKLIAQSPRPRPGFVRFALARKRMLQQAEEQPAIRDRTLRNIQLEDAVFEAVLELQRASPEERSAVREKVRSKVDDMVEAFFDEREERIERLEARLAEEKQRLDEDRENKEQRVENMLRQFMVEPPGAGLEGAREDPAATAPEGGAPVTAMPVPQQ